MFKNKIIFFLIVTILFSYGLDTKIIDYELQAVNGEYDINFSKEYELGYGEAQLLSFRHKEALFDKLDTKILSDAQKNTNWFNNFITMLIFTF